MWKPPELSVSGGFFLIVGWFAVSCGGEAALLVLSAALLPASTEVEEGAGPSASPAVEAQTPPMLPGRGRPAAPRLRQ